MKKTLITSLLFLASCLALLSCSDGEEEQAASLGQPVITVAEVTSSSIAVTWGAIEGARQYGYRITSPDGEDIEAGVTKNCNGGATGLTPFTMYTVTVTAFPVNLGAANASETAISIPTLFYDAIEDSPTAYVSHLQANLATVTNRGTMNEDRTGEGYTENTYGVFTISKFCGVNGHDMVFTVNRDNTITILNGERMKDEDGTDTRTVVLTTGKSSSATLSFDKIYIDESSAVFNGPGHTLTFSAKNNGTGEKLRTSDSETITWE